MDVQRPPKRVTIGQAVGFLVVLFAVLLAPAVVVYLASGGSATVMNDLGHLYVALAIPIGLAVMIIGMVVSMLVSRVQRKRRGPRV